MNTTRNLLVPQAAARRVRWQSIVAVAIAVLGGCTGAIEVPAGSSGAPDDWGTDVGSAPLRCEASEGVIPAPALTRRLTNREYIASLRAIFDVVPENVRGLPADVRVKGFDNNAGTLVLSTLHLETYRAIAEAVADEVLRSEERRARVIGCDPSEGEACLRAVATRVGRRAFRRALSESDVDRLISLAQIPASLGDPDPDAGLRLMLEGILQSPNFLIRTEVGVPDPDRPGVHRLTGMELATRLSYMLVGAPPDDALLDAAEGGELDTPEGLLQQVRILLASPAAREAVRHFYGQWLRLPDFDRLEHSPASHPLFTEEARAAMLEETTRLVDDHVWGEGMSFLDVLVAPYTYVNSPLAAIYGLPAPAEGFSRVELPSGGERRGLLTHASVLAISARDEEIAPILRGHYVRDVFLCTPPPPPPKDIPALPPEESATSQRERLEQHRADPSCRGCHELMDPLGFGFERYDAIGVYRERDRHGEPLSGEGEIVGFTPARFVGPIELAERLHAAPETRACLVRHLFRYVYGRTEVREDACAIDEAERAFADAAYRFDALIAGVVGSDAFRYVQAPPSASGELCP